MARESVYKTDVAGAVNAGAKVKTIQLYKKGVDGKTYNQETQEIFITDLNQALAFVSGNEDHLWTLISDRVANPMIQANDRRKLAIAAEGPQKAITDQIDALVSGGAFTNEEAVEFVVSKYKAKGLVPADYEYVAK